MPAMRHTMRYKYVPGTFPTVLVACSGGAA
jgi:hypothetical protein